MKIGEKKEVKWEDFLYFLVQNRTLTTEGVKINHRQGRWYRGKG